MLHSAARNRIRARDSSCEAARGASLGKPQTVAYFLMRRPKE